MRQDLLKEINPMYDCVQVAKATLENKDINSKSVSIIWRSDFNFADEILRSHENVLSDDLISCKCIQLFDREFPATETTDNTSCVKHKHSERNNNCIPMSSQVIET